MKNKSNNHLGTEIEPEFHYKLKYLSEYESRSMNGQILHLIRQAIREFEKRDRIIELTEDKK